MEPLASRTAFVDELIQTLWPGVPGVTVLAVGGYGRAELFPFSDIDLLFLTARKDLKEPLAPFLRDLWDAGLWVSQSVHSLEECLHVDDRNVELSISLLDRRFLLGDREPFDKLRDPQRNRLAPVLAKITRKRHAEHASTIYHLEPNIKDAPGGLRDLQVFRWLSKLEGGPVPAVSKDLLFRLRTMLHEFAKRDQNVLRYDMQERAAADLGYADAAALMRAYYREARPIHQCCLRRLETEESRLSPLFANFRDRSSRLSNADFTVIRGRVYLRASPRDPGVIARLVEFVARHGLPLSRDTEDRVALVGEIITLGWGELRRILDLPFSAVAMRAMHDTDVLFRVFPEFAAIESLVIRDYYHRYTVDEHTLVAIDTACELRNGTGPFSELARAAAGYPLLLTALLFHDIGKASESEGHADASARAAEKALHRIAMPQNEIDRTLFLIRNHLAMSRFMLTRDLQDPETAAALGKLVGTVEQLKLLAVLTYCDISAVHPGALTPWRSTLLWQLYIKTERSLTESLETGRISRYLLIHTAEEIAQHRRMEEQDPSVRLERKGPVYRMDVVTRDRTALLADIAGALASFGMNILRAEAFTNERGFAILPFTFADPVRTLELNPSEQQRLKGIVIDVVDGRRRVRDLLRARRPVLPSQAPAWTRFDNGASPLATLFEIGAEDRPGLLYDLASAISSAGCNIEVVLVDTEGRRAIDVFYLTRDEKQLDDAEAVRLSAGLQSAAYNTEDSPR